jgi:hypothetical protein
LNRAPCHHDTALGFEHRQRDAVRDKVWIARAESSLIEHLNPVVTALERRECFGRVRMVGGSHPEDATGVEETEAGVVPRIEVAPEFP